jgi:hypothetical protein
MSSERMFSGLSDIVMDYHWENKVSGTVIVAGGVSNLTGTVDQLRESLKEERLTLVHRDGPERWIDTNGNHCL